jgi:hypothetical protein
MPNGAPKHFIVIVPGYMGSMLGDRHTGETFWIDVPSLLKNPLQIGQKVDRMLEMMVYPNDALQPTGILERGVLYALPWARLDHYGRLTEMLGGLGYDIEPQQPDPERPAVYKFAYDWRQDNRISARQLGEAVARWRDQNGGAQAWLIGHSNGGIVSRWFIEKEGGKEIIGRLFLMGSPWDGAPKAIRVMLEGMEVVGRRLLNRFGLAERMRQLMLSFPSYYQLIPHTNQFLRDQNNQVIDPYADDRWLEGERQREYLKDALAFNRELGNNLSVDTVCFFGRFKPTTTSGVVSVGPGGRWERVDWIETNDGDATVPEHSAVYPQASARYAFAVDHGSIYIDPQMLAQLEWELNGKYLEGERAALVTGHLAIVFNPEKPFYRPGETVQLWATVNRSTRGGEPVSGVSIRARLAWREPLPGEAATPPANLPTVDLFESEGEPGRYETSLTAPAQEGFYQLTAVVRAAGEPAVQLEEALAVEED